jgi:hypothetical protein
LGQCRRQLARSRHGGRPGTSSIRR